MYLRSLLAVGLACGLLGAVASAGRDAAPPPGATALCRDGTYSFSQTHSGTCSHHGGVAQWLDGASAPPPGSSVTLGRTVLISPRTKTGHCELGANPDRACSPGAYYSGLTRAVLCSASFHTSTIRNVPQREKFAVETEYGLKPGLYGSSLEIDHIVALELGGSNDIANLYPEKLNAGPGYRVKDRLENKTHGLVCAGGITLHASQVGIATNWQLLYKRVFGKSV